MSDFLWPSDMDRAENEELNRVCERLEEVEAHLDAIRAAARAPYSLPIAMKFDTHWCRNNPQIAAEVLQAQSAGMIRARKVNNKLRAVIEKADHMVNAAMNEGAGPAMRNAVDAYLEQKGKTP